MSNPISTNRSFWHDSVSMAEYPVLRGDLEVPVCIVGGGIAGLTAAYLLARNGVGVALCEARTLGAGETGRTTAHLAVPDDRYWYLEDQHGPEAARAVADSFDAAIELVETIVSNESIDCDFERLDGYLMSCADDPGRELLREHEAARRAGVRTSGLVRSPIPGLGSSMLCFERQAQFHPLRYLNGLARALERMDASIFTGTFVEGVEERKDEVIVQTRTGCIRAGAVLVATNTPINDRVVIHTKQTAWQSYVVAARVPRGELPRFLLWDDADPYHYVRLASMDSDRDELLIVGGEDRKTGQDADPRTRFNTLDEWLHEHFPMAGPIAYRWSGEIMEPLDGVAFLGRNPGNRNVYIITGDSGNGMTHATAGAMLVCDLISKHPNPWESVYDPSRKAMREAGQFIREQSNIVSQYRDWVTSGDERSVSDLARGEATIVRDGLKKLAVYRDVDGDLHCHSAVCPHLGCIVRWNEAAATWDCPCHGSRFGFAGEVLHGPATTNLASADLPDDAGIKPGRAPTRQIESRKRNDV